MERNNRRAWALTTWSLTTGLLTKGFGTHVLAALSGGTVLLLAGTILAGTLPDDGKEAAESLPALCDGWHKSGGGTDPIDLGEVERACRGLKSAFERGVAQAPKDFEAFLSRPHRVGLPACRGSGYREEKLKVDAPPGLAGRLLYFASLTDPGSFRVPREILDAEGSVILLLDAKRTADIGKLAGRIGKPVYLASADLARALGVRCSGTLVRISEKGDTLELREGL